MELLVIFGVAVVLLVVVLVRASGRPKREAKKLVGMPLDRARMVMMPEERYWLIEVSVTGVDADALESAFGSFMLDGDMAGELIEGHLKRAVSRLSAAPVEPKALETALLPRLQEAIASDGFRVDRVRALGSVDLSQPPLRNLTRYVATECSRRDGNLMLSCPVADLYLDGSTGRGDWEVECAPRPGAIVGRLSSVELLNHRDHIVEVTKDGASIVTSRSLAQMLRGE